MVVELIAKDKKEKLQFEGRCKIRIDSVSKILLVEPKIEEFKMISAMFKWKFVAEKNILFVFAEHDFQDFALIFDNSKICNKVFDCLIKRDAVRGDAQLILQRFLPPFFDEISKNNGTNSKFVEILVDFINKHGEKEEYIQLLKDYNIFDLCYPDGVNNKRRNLRKRKAKDITNVDENMVSENASDFSRKSYSFISDRSSIKKRKVQFKAKEIIEAPFFEIFKYTKNNILRTRLFLFPSSDRKYCHEFFWNKYYKCYFCSCCPWRNNVIATVCQSVHGKDVVKLSKNKDGCKLREFNQEKYKDDIIVNKSMYTFVTLKSRINVTKKYLIIFTTEEKDFCYKFFYSNHYKCYQCSKCNSSKAHFQLSATIQNEGQENEIVYLNNKKHICEPLKYSDILQECNRKIVIASNFQLIKRKIFGKIIQKMVTFTNDENSECFEYTWNANNDCFICYACKTKHKIHVFARIINNDETEEEFVELGQTEHKCNPIKFIPEDITAKIVKEPDFKLWEIVFGKKKVLKLTIFDSKNKNFGYIYSYDASNKKYNCMECKKKNKTITAKVLQDEIGQNYVEMSKNEHVCKLKKL